MNNQPILSICIPTYNRADSIQRQVRLILSQLTEDVKLIVIDNHSEKPVIELFTKEELEKFTIIRNEFNIGGDANIAKCFQLCNTKWLWTLSDDDYLRGDAVNYVLSFLKEDPDCTFFNFHYNIDDTIRGYNDFLKRCKIELYSSLFWMSICVYNTERLSNYMQYYFSAISSMQPGIVLLIRALHREPTNYLRFIKSNLFQEKNDVYNVSWSRSSFVYSSLFLFDLLRDLEKELNSTLFTTITQECIAVAFWNYKIKLNKRESLQLLRIILKRRGLYNILRYNIWYFIKVYFSILFGIK